MFPSAITVERSNCAIGSLGDLTRNAVTARDGDWLTFSTDQQGDPKWGEWPQALYGSLGMWATEGRIDVVGEDGERWAYIYGSDGVTQEGTNGWDGTTEPSPLSQESFEGPSAAEQIAARRQHRPRYNGPTLLLALRSIPTHIVDNPAAVALAGPQMRIPGETDPLGLRYALFDSDEAQQMVNRAMTGLRRGLGDPQVESNELIEEAIERLAAVAIIIVVLGPDQFSERQYQHVEELRALHDGMLLRGTRSWEWVDDGGIRRTVR